ncbi:trypsin-like serine protease [Streptomyces sp. p1417]|uniref:Trypsin-like serine protease n=1 Tax=Streptomyces typhae TaxID=2681492 RepID=A0A6L6X4W4_9ACTN|nr:S1 family peptidase [Streptomyces typhae]MVO88757.1 trypsin-like serine protease [Streptomyces typhae]
MSDLHRNPRSVRRATLTGIASLALLGGVSAVPDASASAALSAPAADGPDALSAAAAARLADRLDDALGARDAGSYYDAERRTLVVNVLDRAAAARAEDAGARARFVDNSLAELDSAQRVLDDAPVVPGTSWAMDPRTNRIAVEADRTVTGSTSARLRHLVAGLGDRATLTRISGELTPLMSGGDAVYSSGGRCSLGFNVVKDGKPHFLLAGHCGKAGTKWGPTRDSAVAVTEDSRFPGDDFALVRYTQDVPHPSEVNLYNGTTQRITRAGEATVGLRIQRSGSTTQLRGGKVTALNATVTYQGGRKVTGLIKTDTCADRGDSGGSMFAGDTALGLASGGTVGCGGGRKGPIYFQPVTEALTAYGATITPPSGRPGTGG